MKSLSHSKRPKPFNYYLLKFLILSLCSIAGASEVDLGEYLKNFDLKWDKMPGAYEEGAFLGNGEQGTNIWAIEGESLHFDLGDARVYSGRSRTPIGKFVLKTKGKRKAIEMNLSLWDAEALGKLTTDEGEVSFRAITHASKNLNLVEFKVSGNEQIDLNLVPLPFYDSNTLRLDLRKALKISTIVDYALPELQKASYELSGVKKLPKEVFKTEEGFHQRHVSDGKGSGYTLTWSLREVESNHYLFAWRIDYAFKGYKAFELSTELQNDFKMPYEQLRSSHVKFWNDYYSNAFISLPHKRMEANYWVQIYKMGAATRAGKLPIDLMGPWFRATPWPRIWANLNVQLSYLPQAVANKPEIASTLADFIDRKAKVFTEATKEFSHDSAGMGRGMSPYGTTGTNGEYGNFLWMLYDYWHFLRIYPDNERKLTKFYPLLKRGINLILHLSYTDENGIIHTPKDISPEYKINNKFPKSTDTPYNLFMLQWAMQVAIEIDANESLNDPDALRYTKALKKLAPLPVKEGEGIMIGEGVPVATAHRHYSHLVGLYPLRVMDVDDKKQHALAKLSLDHWISRDSKKYGGYYTGYSYTGATAMYAMLDEPEKAIESMENYMAGFMLPNTFYLEAGPVIETPLSSAAATQELLIQSWRKNNEFDVVRLFPGIPKSWPVTSFDSLRAEGAYRVSASFEKGQTTGFKIEAVEDGALQLRVKAKDLQGLKTSSDQKPSVQVQGQWQYIQVNLKKGDVLTWGNQMFKQSAPETNGKETYHFGLNAESKRHQKTISAMKAIAAGK